MRVQGFKAALQEERLAAYGFLVSGAVVEAGEIPLGTVAADGSSIHYSPR